MEQRIEQKMIDQAGAASDSPSSGNLTTSKSSEVMSPFWSRSSGWVVIRPVRSWRRDNEAAPFMLNPRVIMRNAWTRRKTNSAANTIGKRNDNIGSTLPLCHRDIGWLSQHVNDTRCQNCRYSNQSEDGRGVVAHNRTFLWRNVTRFCEHPWTLEPSSPKAESRKTTGSREDASITGTLKEDFLFLRDGWLSTSTGSSIEVRALQQEERLWTRHGKS